MRASQFSLSAATKRYADRLVLDRVDLTLRPGDRVGVVGDNGAGKSTLLGVIAGDLGLDNGHRRIHAPGGIASARQALELPASATVQDAIDHVLAGLRSLEARIRSLEERLATASDPDLAPLLEEYAAVTASYDARDGYASETRVDAGLAALGLPGLDRERPFNRLSGGEQARLALAAALASEAELLLLDEPTNDLDDAAISWLEDRLARHRGTVVAVSHDRAFLDRLTSVILEVDCGAVRRYGDGYDGYLAAKRAERHQQQAAYERWRLELGRQERLLTTHAARLDAIPRAQEKPGFGHGAFRGRSRDHGATSRIRNAKERLARLSDAPVAPPPDPLVLTADLTATADVGDEWLLDLDGVDVPGRLRLDRLRLAAGERLLVTGPNGAGKSTLLQTIAGEVAITTGSLRAPDRIGYLRQIARRWPRGTTLLAGYAHGRDAHPDDLADELLALGLFEPGDVRRPVADLSYGQRRRLELARVVAQPVDLLLLDEPTNHLTPAVVEELETALQAYPGAAVLVTHDRRMRDRFAGARVELEKYARNSLSRPVGSR